MTAAALTEPASVMDRFRLDGRVAVVTGASSGLGAEIAVTLACAGADLVITARAAERLVRTTERIEALGRAAWPVVADVAVAGSARQVAHEAARRFGRIDVLVNNAGISAAAPASRERPEDLQRIVATNLYGSYWMAQACIAHMPAGSAIVNVGSVLGSTTAGLPQAAYSASKAALLGLSRDLAAQWSLRRGVRVNTVVPGIFGTDMTSHYPPGYVEDLLARRVVLGRVGSPDELAAEVLFLASPASSYVVGAEVAIDGGLLIT